MSQSLLLNADVGEGMPGDDDIIACVDLANIAAGGHAGGGETLERAIDAALRHDVRIGAHPSYPDQENFGRMSRWNDMSETELADSLREQILSVATTAHNSNAHISYIKPHGALYNDAAAHPHIAEFIARVITDVSKELQLPQMPSLPVMLLANAPGTRHLMERGVPLLQEGFADRAYTSAGLLLPRDEPGAVLHDSRDILDHVTRMWHSNYVLSNEGTAVTLRVDTVCVHGDTPDAVRIAKDLRTLVTSWQN